MSLPIDPISFGKLRRTFQPIKIPKHSKFGKLSKKHKPTSEYMGWAAIGEVAGHLLALVIPGTIISASSLGHIMAALLGGLYSLGVLRTFKSNEGSELHKQLLDIDLLFLQNKINEEERQMLRHECLLHFRDKLGHN